MSDLREKLAQFLHWQLSAAQNLPFDDGDTCVDCFSTVDTDLLPIITDYEQAEVTAALGEAMKAVRDTPFRCHSSNDKEFESGCKQTREADLDVLYRILEKVNLNGRG